MKKIFYLLISFLFIMSSLFGSFPVSAERELQIGDEVNINGIKATIVSFQNKFPIYQSIIYPNIDSSSSDGYIVTSTYPSGTYNSIRTSATGNLVTTGDSIVIENSTNGTYFGISRGYLYFTTSALNGYAITAGTVNVYVWNKYDTDNESIQIQSGMPTYPHDPLVAGDYDLTNYAVDTDCGSKDITTFNIGVYNSITLDASGITQINTSGTTKFCLRTSGDINNIVPTDNNKLYFYNTEKGDGYKPYLSVTYTALTPAINSVAASNIATTSARLNSLITDNGGDPTCQIEFGYGTTSKLAANFATYDTITTVTVPKSDYTEAETPYLDVSGLTDTTTYYFRVRITNELTSVVSTDEQTFDTIASLDDMINFIGYPEEDNISLNWVKAGGATSTVVRYRLDTYPTSATGADGSISVCDTTAIVYVHSGLDEGTTYYYSAWGKSGATYSTNAINLAMTTTGGIASDTLPVPSVPSGMYQEPDETFLANLQPFYSVINGLADTWGMPRGNMWFALVMLVVLAAGVGSYIPWRAPAFSLLLMAIVMALFVMTHILPQFMYVVVAFLALGGWSTRPQGV